MYHKFAVVVAMPRELKDLVRVISRRKAHKLI